MYAQMLLRIVEQADDLLGSAALVRSTRRAERKAMAARLLEFGRALHDMRASALPSMQHDEATALATEMDSLARLSAESLLGGALVNLTGLRTPAMVRRTIVTTESLCVLAYFLESTDRMRLLSTLWGAGFRPAWGVTVNAPRGSIGNEWRRSRGI